MKSGRRPNRSTRSDNLKGFGSTGSALTPRRVRVGLLAGQGGRLARFDQRGHRPLHGLPRRMPTAARVGRRDPVQEPRRRRGGVRRAGDGARRGDGGARDNDSRCPRCLSTSGATTAGERYRESYFGVFPGVWRHGDWIRIDEDGGCVIYGRSDATIKRMGVRMGTSEVYRVVESIPQVADSLVVDMEFLGGRSYMPLFVVLQQRCQPRRVTEGGDTAEDQERALAEDGPRRDHRGPGGTADPERQEGRGPGEADIPWGPTHRRPTPRAR